ncbi:hypothetical protein [Klebsiella electrica]|uniref:hypothetical protein n=1 Tax=Klebsiella/Raoultella group TaxID=2890311 RepID=UPI00135213D1|nr:hypothetical protein [Klebsiella electrica]MXF46559.1 hypothetical protein [Raoultella sp. Lac2]MXF99706.1 hypothetical protein [Raoultella sp. Lac1]WIO41919.1 hypothetical protein P2G42_18695 [Klebsiella electrica]
MSTQNASRFERPEDGPEGMNVAKHPHVLSTLRLLRAGGIRPDFADDACTSGTDFNEF